jgi:hypothetical protein
VAGIELGFVQSLDTLATVLAIDHPGHTTTTSDTTTTTADDDDHDGGGGGDGTDRSTTR